MNKYDETKRILSTIYGDQAPNDAINEWWSEWFRMIDGVEETVEKAKANVEEIKRIKEVL